MGFRANDSSPEPLLVAYPGNVKPLKTYTPSTENQDNVTVDSTEMGVEPVYVLAIPQRRPLTSRVAGSNPRDKRLFKVSVPMPRYLSQLYTDRVAVLPDSAPSLKWHATGLKFFYQWDGRSEIVIQNAGGAYDITPPVFRHIVNSPDIQMRYEGLDILDENDPHSDAYSCFSSLACLAGVPWWIEYGDGRTSPLGPAVPDLQSQLKWPDPCAQNVKIPPLKTGADCYSPAIVSGLVLP